MTNRTPSGETRAMERQWVLAARDGDSVAFGELLRVCDRAVRATTWRLVGDPNHVDDVLQEAYLKAFRSLRNFDPDGAATFGSWLHHIVHSAAIDHHRHASRRPPSARPTDAERPPATTAGADSEVARRTALRNAFATLEPHLAAAVALVDGEGFSQAEAARFLGLGTSTVSRHINEGRSRLRTHLASEGVLP